jgi:hypothetical protein
MRTLLSLRRLCLAFAVSLCIPVDSVLAAAAPNSPPKPRAVELGPPIDLSSLAVNKQTGLMTAAPADVRTETLTFQIDAQSCLIYATTQGYDWLMVGGLQAEAQHGQPLLPMKTFKVELDRETEILGLEVVEGTFREIKTELNLIPANLQLGANALKVIADDKIYSSDAWFPGRLVSIDQGVDNQRRYVFAHLFPVQYAPAQKKAMLLTQATLKLSYRHRSPADASGQATLSQRMQKDQAGGLATEAQCIVLCPTTLQQEAERLSRFHATQEGITSAVVTTEAIGQAYLPAEDPPLEGYQNAQLDGWGRIRHYDYALARKIVAYLRDQPAHPRLVYVTILGDGLLVPPSFYFYCRPYDTLKPVYRPDHEIHRKWVPTDLFYGSPDYDWVPNYRVGRLSVNDANEAAHVVDKVIRWHENADWSWFRNVQVSGTLWLLTYKAESEGLFEGMNLKRCLHGDDRADRVFLEPALTTRDTGLVFCASHGTVSRLVFVGSPLSADDLLHYAPHIKVPILISMACWAGTFDLDLMECSCATWGPSRSRGSDFFEAIYPRCTHSFGEGVLNSPAAGIAYLGNSREGHGSSGPPVSVGVLVAFSGKDYVVPWFYGAMQSRRQGADTLGQLYTDALFDFLSTADMAGNPWNAFTALEFVLLGDPALRIPVRP